MLRFFRRKCKFRAYFGHLSHLLRIRSIAPIFGAAKDSVPSYVYIPFSEIRYVKGISKGFLSKVMYLKKIVLNKGEIIEFLVLVLATLPTYNWCNQNDYGHYAVPVVSI
jgi:hypothetical protein